MKLDDGNDMGSTRIYNLHAKEEPEGDTHKVENCDFVAEMEALSPQDKEKETCRFRKFCSGKEEKQVNNSPLIAIFVLGVPFNLWDMPNTNSVHNLTISSCACALHSNMC